MAVRIPSGWLKVEWKKAEKGFQRILISDISKKEEKVFTKYLIDMQESFVRDLPSDERPFMPFITGNLHDSIVAVTSLDGRVVRASYPDRVATKPAKGEGRTRIIGSVAAQTLVRNMNGRYPDGIAISLFVGVPYSMRPQVRGKHTGYLDILKQNFAYSLESGFRLIESHGFAKFTGLNLDQALELYYDSDDMRLVTRPKKRGRPKGSGGYMGAAIGGMKMIP